jgi:hypothetical protein
VTCFSTFAHEAENWARLLGVDWTS